jgi:triosephosphate isomerase
LFCDIAAETVVSPPYVFLPTVKASLRPEIQVAAQNCWVKKGGAFTGEVRLVFASPSFLSSFITMMYAMD